jgi:hypothetical protein
VETISASDEYPSIDLSAPNGLPLSDGAWLSYCLVGDGTNSVEDLTVFHEGQAAPLVEGHTPSAKENCARFRSLSFWHHLKHAAKGAVHGAEGAAKGAVHGLESATKSMDHAAGEAGGEIAKGAKAGFKIIKGLLNPCKTCEHALNAGIKAFECGQTGKQAAESVEECSKDVSEAEPEVSEYSPLLCGAIESGAKLACKHGEQNTHALAKVRHKIVKEACKVAHLCR